MKRRIDERGDMMTVIFAVLVVALMTAVGIIFYQNFATKKPNEGTQTSKTPPATGEHLKTERLAFNSDIYAIDYPDNWSLIKSDVGEKTVTGKRVQLTSPSGEVRVTYAVSTDPNDTSCDQLAQISDYDVEENAVTKLGDAPLYVVSAIISNPKGGYNYKAGLVPDGGDTHAKANDDACNIRNVGFVSDVHYDGEGAEETLVSPSVRASIDFAKLPEAPNSAAKDRQTLRELMSADDYKTAVKILESARKE